MKIEKPSVHLEVLRLTLPALNKYLYSDYSESPIYMSADFVGFN